MNLKRKIGSKGVKSVSLRVKQHRDFLLKICDAFNNLSATKLLLKKASTSEILTLAEIVVLVLRQNRNHTFSVEFKKKILKGNLLSD